MSKLDQLIEDALGAEDRALFSNFGERGLLAEAGGLFTGKMGWWNALSTAIQVVMVAAALFAGREFMAANDVAAMLRWGGLVGLLFMAMSMIKLMHWQQMQANRIIREVKRLQLQIARAKD